jgi:hypothetical protein
MTINVQQLQLAALALIVSLITVGSFTYILWKQPASLRQSRDGVPFFTPQVIHPDTGEAISVEELVEHFKKGG